MLTGAVVGLVGLLGGCEKEGIWTRDECRVGSLTMKAQYHQISGDLDYCNFLFSGSDKSNDKSYGGIERAESNAVIYCDDGRAFNADACAFVKRP